MSGQIFVNLTCTAVGPSCPVEASIYGYLPSVPLNAFFVAIFALLGLVHLFLGVTYKTYFIGCVLSVGCIAEAIGYGGRLMLHKNPFDGTGFSMQISCLIFAPSFIAAAVYVSLKQIVEAFGETGSLLKPPMWYTYIFIGCDIVCLVLQAVGGGMAGSAGRDSAKRDLGTNLMIAGIVAQVFTLVVFMALVLVYTVRTKKRWTLVSPAARAISETTKFKMFIVGLCIAFFTIFTRCVYRIPELVKGWASPIMRDEISFVILEGL